MQTIGDSIRKGSEKTGAARIWNPNPSAEFQLETCTEVAIVAASAERRPAPPPLSATQLDGPELEPDSGSDSGDSDDSSNGDER